MTAPVARAAILAVGSELLTPARLDTNSLHITGVLDELGIAVAFKAIVGDDRRELAAQVAHALARVDLVVLTGGLGPTDDDLTREVVAEQLGLPLEEDPAILDKIRRRFEARGWRMPETNRRQAQVPRGARVLDNAHGTAPGLWIEHDGRGVALLPGPPREMKPILRHLADTYLAPKWGGLRLIKRVLKVAGRTESRVEELTQPIYSTWLRAAPPIETTILASPGQIELHLSTRTADEAAGAAALDRAVASLDAVLGPDVFTHDDRSLEQVVGELLGARGWRIAAAESCSGGLLTSRLTDVPGSSAYVERSVVAYSNEAKVELLGVPVELFAAHGAVSEPVAAAMAEGIRARAGVDVGVGITGIAGPSGGSEQKPVGMVCIAVASRGPAGEAVTRVRTFRFPGNREMVKTLSAFTGLDMVRRLLTDADAAVDWLDNTEARRSTETRS